MPRTTCCASLKRQGRERRVGQLRSIGRRGSFIRFRGRLTTPKRALEMGLAISFSGLAFRAGEEVSASVARLVPVDRLLIETDSPYLSPPGAPRRRNEPLWVEVTARWLASVRDMTADDLGDALVANYDLFFG